MDFYEKVGGFEHLILMGARLMTTRGREAAFASSR